MVWVVERGLEGKFEVHRKTRDCGEWTGNFNTVRLFWRTYFEVTTIKSTDGGFMSRFVGRGRGCKYGRECEVSSQKLAHSRYLILKWKHFTSAPPSPSQHVIGLDAAGLHVFHCRKCARPCFVRKMRLKSLRSLWSVYVWTQPQQIVLTFTAESSRVFVRRENIPQPYCMEWTTEINFAKMYIALVSENQLTIIWTEREKIVRKAKVLVAIVAAIEPSARLVFSHLVGLEPSWNRAPGSARA